MRPEDLTDHLDQNLQRLDEQLADLENAQILADQGNKAIYRQRIQDKKAEIDRYRQDRADRFVWNPTISKNIPYLLPYLPDRDPQRDELDEALKQFKQQHSKRPIVCILHGDEKQGHDSFIHRLQEEILPQFLGIEEGNVKKYRLPWPTRQSEFGRQLERNLLSEYKAESLDDFNDFLAKIPAPALIHAQCYTSDWQAQGLQILDAFLEFWQAWPDLAINQILIVCLCVSYHLEEDLDFFSKRKRRSLNQKICKHLEDLSISKRKKFDRLITTVLPKLDNISCTQAEDWADCRASKFIENDRSVLELKKSIREFYRQWHRKYASDKIPMEKLAEHLTELLSK